MEFDPEQALVELARQVQTGLGSELSAHLVVGIHTGGYWVAERLSQMLSLPEPASLDISYHRDDVNSRGMNPHVQPSRLPLNLDDRQILLVDDVLHTGRTVRAALNELFDYGRPQGIRLAVLLDRGGKQLPITADFCAQTLKLPAESRIKIDGPTPLRVRPA